MGGRAGLVRRAGRVGGYVWPMTRDVHDLVRDLNDGLGTAVVQAITGVKDRGQPARWARPDGPEPAQASIDRLRLAGRVWRMLEQAEGRDVALAWMVGANHRLDEATPVTAIREMRTSEVVGAAQAFIDGSPSA